MELHNEQILRMENLKHKQWHIFWITTLVVAFAILLRLWILLPLYTDLTMRNRTQALIQATAKREGWLLSGLRIERIEGDSIRLLYRSYIRGEDPQSCHNLHTSTGKLTPCDDS
jgi:hypothetical protein